MTAVFVNTDIALIFAMVNSDAIGDFFVRSKPHLNNNLLSRYPSIVPVSYSNAVPRPIVSFGVLYKPCYPNNVYSVENTIHSPSIMDIPSRLF